MLQDASQEETFLKRKKTEVLSFVPPPGQHMTELSDAPPDYHGPFSADLPSTDVLAGDLSAAGSNTPENSVQSRSQSPQNLSSDKRDNFHARICQIFYAIPMG